MVGEPVVRTCDEGERHFRLHNMFGFKQDGLQQQKSRLGSTPVSQEEKSIAAVGIGSPKLGTW